MRGAIKPLSLIGVRGRLLNDPISVFPISYCLVNFNLRLNSRGRVVRPRTYLPQVTLLLPSSLFFNEVE